ncbi:MAG: GntR family transcriptional regulator [Rhodoferax sp.]|nr:GntR family transcriptional regulator [Rhodoferax sp.]
MVHTVRSRPVRPLTREGTLSDRIYAELRTRLQRAPLQPDERLVDLEVAAAYGTSRMPARDALLRLLNEGYLLATTRGFVAPSLSLDDIREIFEVRRLLEPEAVASVARDVDDATLARLAAALQQARQATSQDDGDKMVLANMAYREAWLGRVSNKRLAATIARFVDHVQTVRRATLSNAPTRAIVLDGLTRVHAALCERDARKARKCMTDFMLAAEKAFFAVRKAEIDGH